MTDDTGEYGQEPGDDAGHGAVSIYTYPQGDDGNALRVEVRGDLVINNARYVGAALEAACSGRSEDRIEPGWPQDILMDLRKVDTIDSAGLALLVHLRMRMGGLCRFALLLSPRTQTERVVRLSHIDQAIPVVASPEAFDALRRLDSDNPD